jgi:hypothetical protein
MWQIDPFGLTSGTVAGITGTPTILVADVGQSNIYVHTLGAPVTLDRVLAVPGTVTPDVYSFVSLLPYVRDAVIRIVNL